MRRGQWRWMVDGERLLKRQAVARESGSLEAKRRQGPEITAAADGDGREGEAEAEAFGRLTESPVDWRTSVCCVANGRVALWLVAAKGGRVERAKEKARLE